MKITLEIPDGPRCCFSPTRRCKLCSYAGHLQDYNCRYPDGFDQERSKHREEWDV